MISDVEKVVREYLPEVIHLSLATSRNNVPWMCELMFSFDSDLNLYFRSLSSTRHCQEILENPVVAGNIVKQHLPGQKPRGVYFEGVASVCENVDANHPAFLSYSQRFGGSNNLLEQNEDTPRFYQVSVKRFFVFDAVESPGMKYELPWK